MIKFLVRENLLVPRVVLPNACVRIQSRKLVDTKQVSAKGVNVINATSEKSSLNIILVDDLDRTQRGFKDTSSSLALIQSLRFVCRGNNGAICTVNAKDYDTCALRAAFGSGPRTKVALRTGRPKTTNGSLGVGIVRNDSTNSQGMRVSRNSGESSPCAIDDLTTLRGTVANASGLMQIANLGTGIGSRLPSMLAATADFANKDSPSCTGNLRTLRRNIVGLMILTKRSADSDTVLATLRNRLAGATKVGQRQVKIVKLKFTTNGAKPVPRSIPTGSQLVLIAPNIILGGNTKLPSLSLSSNCLTTTATKIVSSLPIRADPAGGALSVSKLASVFGDTALRGLIRGQLLIIRRQSKFQVIGNVAARSNT